MDFFFQRHFGYRHKRQKLPVARQPGASIQTSKARRRSSVGLPSVALAQSRRSSIGLPPVSADQRRRPSVGLLVASGQKRRSVVDLGLAHTGQMLGDNGEDKKREIVPTKRGRRAFQHKAHDIHWASGNISCAHSGLAVQNPQPYKVKSIEPHLLGSSMLLASMVQMGRGVKEKEGQAKDEEEEEEEEEEFDISLSSFSESDDEKESDEKLESRTRGIEDANQRPTCQMPLTQPVIMKNIKPHSLLRPPRCLRRNSSHLLPAESVFQNSETGFGVYGRYSRRSSDQYTQIEPIKTSMTSPSLGQLSSAGMSSDPEGDETQVTLSGSTLPTSYSSPLGRHRGTMYYNPYLDTWENFLSYVTQTHIHSHILY